MPDLPSYRRKITPKPVGKAPLPISAADVGAGAIGRGLAAIGRGIGDIGRSIFQIEQEKQRIRDNASLASANGDYDKAIANKIDEAKRTTFTSIEQFTDFRKQAESDLDAIVQSSIGKMSTKAGQLFSNFAKNNKQNSLRQIESIVWPKEIQFGQSDTVRQYSNKFEVLAGAGVPVKDIFKDASLKIIEEGMAPYWRAGELVKVRDRTLIDALINVGRYDDARKLAQTTKAFTPGERRTRLANINAVEKAIENKRDSDSKIAASTAIESSYTKIINGDMDIVSMMTAIQTDPVILDEDSNTAVEKIKTFYSTWHSAIDEKIVTSDSTRVKALKIISAVRTTDITKDEGLTRYEKLSKTEKINGIDGKGFINGIFAASKTAESYPLTTNRAKIYFGLLETLYKGGDIEPVEFDRMHTALRNFFEKDPEPTAKEATEFYEELVRDKARDFLDKYWDWWRGSLFGVGYRAITGYEKPKEGEGKAKPPMNPPGSPALTPQGDRIGEYNEQGNVVLNETGIKLLLQNAGGDVNRAREIAKKYGYIIPE